ncbi:MAG: c-type cytochrome [Erythrobacter sp.]
MTEWWTRIAGAALLAMALPVLAACGEQAATPIAADPSQPRLQLVSASPAEHGKRLSRVLGCTGCHNDRLTGNDWSEPGYGTLWSSNLTRSGERWSAPELTQMIVAGRRPDRALMEMPSHIFARLHPEDVAALVAYLESLTPVGEAHPDLTVGPLLQKEIEAGAYKDSAQVAIERKGEAPPDLGADHAFGRQIVGVTCAECHGTDLRGKPASETGANPRPDLRMVASYDPEDFTRLLRTGKAAGNREVGLMSSAARRRYAHLTEGEVAALRSYLVELAKRDP